MAPTNVPIQTPSEEIGQVKALKKQLDRIWECVRANPNDQCEPMLVDPQTGARVGIPLPLLRVLTQATHVLAEGGAVAVLPYHAKLTTQEAADYLGVSRPYLISLLDEGAIPYERLRSHRRILLKDIEAFRARRDAERRTALAELSRESYRLGLYDLPEDANIDDPSHTSGA